MRYHIVLYRYDCGYVNDLIAPIYRQPLRVTVITSSNFKRIDIICTNAFFLDAPPSLRRGLCLPGDALEPVEPLCATEYPNLR